MHRNRDFWDNVLSWTGAITAMVAPFMSFLQFIAVCLAILVSLKSLTRDFREKPRNKNND
jgi:hypothetical protein